MQLTTPIIIFIVFTTFIFLFFIFIISQISKFIPSIFDIFIFIILLFIKVLLFYFQYIHQKYLIFLHNFKLNLDFFISLHINNLYFYQFIFLINNIWIQYYFQIKFYHYEQFKFIFKLIFHLQILCIFCIRCLELKLLF